MVSIVWINWQDYTGLELFSTASLLLWVLAYAIYIRNIITLKYVEMPVFAGCCDVAWEFVWSFPGAERPRDVVPGRQLRLVLPRRRLHLHVWRARLRRQAADGAAAGAAPRLHPDVPF